MKLRIQGDSLRLRVSPSEVKRLFASGRIEETIHFGCNQEARFTYALELKPQAGSISTRCLPQEVTVLVSAADARRWADGSEVGLYGETRLSHGMLQLAVEKDFACLDKSNPENIDTFPNPMHGAEC